MCHLAYLAVRCPTLVSPWPSWPSLTDPGPRPEEGVEAVTTRSDGSIVLTHAAATKASQGSGPRCAARIVQMSGLGGEAEHQCPQPWLPSALLPESLLAWL